MFDQSPMLTWRPLRLLLPGVVATVLAGCGGGEFSTTPVTGKVVMNGQPVTEGVITFAPIGDGKGGIVGKPASGDVAPDGTFSLSTYEDNDGAVVGKHRVAYSSPMGAPIPVPQGGHGAPIQQSQYAGAVVLTPEVEVKAGEDNEFEIEIAVQRR